MSQLTKTDARDIEGIHSNWIRFEVAGDVESLLSYCDDAAELWPPDAPPVRGRAAVSAWMAHGTMRIHDIEITDCRIRGSHEVAYLTANFRTAFSSAGDSTTRHVAGSH